MSPNHYFLRQLLAPSEREFTDKIKTIIEPTRSKPELIINDGDLTETARALGNLLAASNSLYDRGALVRVMTSSLGQIPKVEVVTPNHVVLMAHEVCQPVKPHGDGTREPVTLPDRVARLYLSMRGEWNLHPLVGITTAPVLTEDGTVRTDDGYDVASGLWCKTASSLQLPERPSRADAEAALLELRHAFRTFPFADASRQRDTLLDIDVVDINQAPGQDESGFLVGLLTAICRSSLWLAPGFVVRAPEISGAGTGKGLLVRAICAIAFGMKPEAFTTGGNRQELDKRLAAELVKSAPVLFLDNVNATYLRSDLLAQLLTERPVRTRVLGVTHMVTLNSAAFVAVTGNGLTISEDLARRFIICELDAHCEDPEQRKFESGFLNEIERQRPELMAAALTIWRWGRQNAPDLKPGLALGSFEQWTQWCRDPLSALGCSDPVKRIEAVKRDDPERRRIAELFACWHENHGEHPTRVAELAAPVRMAADPQNHGRQYLEAHLRHLTDTRAGNFVLTREKAAGRWGAATYALRKTTP